MVQDDDRTGSVADESEPDNTSHRSSVWPGVLLVILILVVILLLWWYSQHAEPSPLTAVRDTAPTASEGHRSRPDPVAPTLSGGGEPDMSRVPDVVGDRQRAATDAIRSAGYDARVSNVVSASKASGFVVAQSPSGGTELERGGTVSLVVSVASSAVKNVTMPSIVGLTQASAESKVKAAGLVPYLIYGDTDIAEGRVISQWPGAGESVPVGSEGFIQIQLEN